jgi:hypothetical protein
MAANLNESFPKMAWRINAKRISLDERRGSERAAECRSRYEPHFGTLPNRRVASTRLRPARIANAIAPAPERNASERAKRSGWVRTEATSPGMLDAFPNICELDSRFASVAPDYLAGFFESFLVVCEGDKVFEGGDRATRGESDVRRDSRQGFSWFIVRVCLSCESRQHGGRRSCVVAVVGRHHVTRIKRVGARSQQLGASTSTTDHGNFITCSQRITHG